MELKSRKIIYDSYVIDKASNVLLTITIGNAQIGGNIIKWKNEDEILKKGEVINLNLGKGSEIIGKSLEIKTNILDINDQTNGIVVTNYFYNTQQSAVTFEDIVDNHGDVFSFDEEVNFK